MNQIMNIPTNTMYAHNRAENRYKFTGELKLTHAMHIGSGWGDERTDALVVTNANGSPLIPGSSLRGVLRAEVERLLMGLFNPEDPDSLWACQLYEPNLPSGKHCVGNTAHKLSKDVYEKLNEKNPDQIWQELPDHLCDACRLFGAGTFWASKIRFEDLELEGSAQTSIRHGVGIHRDAGTAAPMVKYDKQVVEAGAVFKFEAMAENLDETDKKLLALCFSRLTSGELTVGGSTSRGLGQCYLEHGHVEWINMTNRKELLEYLKRNKYGTSENLENFVEAGLEALFPDSGAGG